RVEILADRVFPAGRGEVIWNAKGYPSTAYFIRLTIAGDSRVAKVVIIR
ncbi:MAG: hypothetical protein H7X80_08740, partial [bacterium]|nr:hypothetical protein [Candidatus Kapabacteria bacterium]